MNPPYFLRPIEPKQPLTHKDIEDIQRRKWAERKDNPDSTK